MLCTEGIGNATSVERYIRGKIYLFIQKQFTLTGSAATLYGLPVKVTIWWMEAALKLYNISTVYLFTIFYLDEFLLRKKKHDFASEDNV